jgi:hypothetical protein
MPYKSCVKLDGPLYKSLIFQTSKKNPISGRNRIFSQKTCKRNPSQVQKLGFLIKPAYGISMTPSLETSMALLPEQLKACTAT